ncbi:hypothetical protein F5Y02DRAFT_399907 [Annulohypoxylon stygium]|nr:hypothetical protein F5Y02DRAFT_399907 [Annulohypoxylon stygium]
MSQAPGQPAQGQQIRFLKPENIRSISYLSPEEKTRYEEGLRNLYTKMEQNPPESQEHQMAKHRIADFSRMVYNKIKTIHSKNQAGSQPQQGQPGQPGQSSYMNAQPQNPQTEQSQNTMSQVQAQVQAQAQAQAQAQKMANRPQAQMPNNPGGPSTTPNNPVPTNNQIQVPKLIVNHTNQMPWDKLKAPPSVTTPDQILKYQNEMKQRYIRFLVQMENIKSRSQKMEAVMKERQEKGQLSQEDFKKFQEQKVQDQKNYGDAQRFVESVRAQILKTQQNTQQARPQPIPQQSVSTPTTTHPMQAATASVNAAMDAAKNQQLAATRPPVAANQSQQPQSQQPQVQPQVQPQPQQQQHPGTPATPITPAMPPQQQHPQPQQPHPVPTPQIKTEPNNSISRPPPVNTAMAAAASSANMSSTGTPTQPSARVQTPQSAGQQQVTPVPQPVRPLTHAAAVSRANSSTNIPGQANTTPGSGIASTPGASGLVGNANHPGHSHAHPQPSPALNPKMPISKNLPPKALETPQPVSVGGGNNPGRPSLGGGGGLGGGVMGQPVINKMPPVQFDAEGEHVLSKKKLDELVRQVCGGASPGADGNYLTPDVEESVLSVADNFVDQVIVSACRLAKERGSKVLETRDLQLVLERVHNIRIPGYTSDELRTVRKVQPAANWISKVHAVQAAKVMPGKDDK